jgi:hypothetical protein
MNYRPRDSIFDLLISCSQIYSCDDSNHKGTKTRRTDKIALCFAAGSLRLAPGEPRAVRRAGCKRGALNAGQAWLEAINV